MAGSSDSICPKCRDIGGVERQRMIYRHWKPAKDHICGWCGAVYLRRLGVLEFIRYQNGIVFKRT